MGLDDSVIANSSVCGAQKRVSEAFLPWILQSSSRVFPVGIRTPGHLILPSEPAECSGAISSRLASRPSWLGIPTRHRKVQHDIGQRSCTNGTARQICRSNG